MASSSSAKFERKKKTLNKNFRMALIFQNLPQYDRVKFLVIYLLLHEIWYTIF